MVKKWKKLIKAIRLRNKAKNDVRKLGKKYAKNIEILRKNAEYKVLLAKSNYEIEMIQKEFDDETNEIVSEHREKCDRIYQNFVKELYAL